MALNAHCSITAISEIVYNSFIYILKNASPKDGGFSPPSRELFQKDNEYLTKSLEIDTINIVNTFGYFEFDINLLQTFKFIARPYIAQGQISNLPKLSDQEVYINHALILLDLISPKSIKWHAHSGDIQYICWAYEPEYVEDSDYDEDNHVRNEIERVLALYYSITNKDLDKIYDWTHAIYFYSGLLTWSFISVYQSPIKDKPPFTHKFDIFGNVINIAKESSLITSLCSKFYNKTSTNSNYSYFKYIFYNFYNDKIPSTPISRNIAEFALNNINSCLNAFESVDDPNFIFILLRLMNSDICKNQIYQALARYLQIVKGLKDKYIEILLAKLNSSLPTGEADTSLLDVYFECYILSLKLAANKEIVFMNISILIENLWDIRNINRMEANLLKIYIELVRNWNSPCFIHLEKILTLAFNIIERDESAENTILALDSIIVLLDNYKIDIKHYCYDIYYRIWIISARQMNKAVNTDEERQLYIVLDEKVKELVKTCNLHFSYMYSRKCVRKIANLVGDDKNLPLLLALYTNYTTNMSQLGSLLKYKDETGFYAKDWTSVFNIYRNNYLNLIPLHLQRVRDDIYENNYEDLNVFLNLSGLYYIADSCFNCHKNASCMLSCVNFIKNKSFCKLCNICHKSFCQVCLLDIEIYNDGKPGFKSKSCITCYIFVKEILEIKYPTATVDNLSIDLYNLQVKTSKIIESLEDKSTNLLKIYNEFTTTNNTELVDQIVFLRREIIYDVKELNNHRLCASSIPTTSDTSFQANMKKSYENYIKLATQKYTKNVHNILLELGTLGV